MIKSTSSEAVSLPSTGLGAGPDRLDSWKEIATYLKREVRTVQLWEKKEGLPVHRHYHNQLGTVFAFRSEIEQWGMLQACKRQVSARSEARPEDDRAPVRIEVRTADPDGCLVDQPLCRK